MEIDTLSVFAVFVTVLWGFGIKLLYGHIDHVAQTIEMKTPELSMTESIKQEIYDLLSMALDDTVGNIQMPTAWDHALGAISQIIQSKMMSNLPPNLIEGLEDSLGHGRPTQEEENP